MYTAHGPAPRSNRGACRTLSWLAGAFRAWHLEVRLVRTATMLAGLGWAMGTARPSPERAARAEKRAGRMADGWGSISAVLVCVKGGMVRMGAYMYCVDGDRERFINRCRKEGMARLFYVGWVEKAGVDHDGNRLSARRRDGPEYAPNIACL